jgi:hypothetical protein
MITWIESHWRYVLGAIGLLVTIATVINRRLPRDDSGYVKRPASWGAFVCMVVIDLLSLLPQPGKVGVLGPLSLPGTTSLSPPMPPPVPMDGPIVQRRDRGHVMPEVLVVLALLGALALMSSCATMGSVQRSSWVECAGQTSGVVNGIYNGIERGGASWLGLVASVLPCASAIARDLLTRRDLPAEAVSRANTTLALERSVYMLHTSGTLDSPASGETMIGPSGEKMIRGFGR